MRKPPVCKPFPDIFFTIWDAPSEAAPARADNPTVFAKVGPKVRASDNIEVKSEPPTCFLMLVLSQFDFHSFSISTTFFQPFYNI